MNPVEYRMKLIRQLTSTLKNLVRNNDQVQLIITSSVFNELVLFFNDRNSHGQINLKVNCI